MIQDIQATQVHYLDVNIYKWHVSMYRYKVIFKLRASQYTLISLMIE